jgi:hypothetical protein
MIRSPPVHDSYHAQKLVSAVQIRSRYNKSKDNFTIRKFSSLDHPFLDQVDASVSILRRAHLLRVPSAEPLGVFTSSFSVPFTFITATTVTQVMHHACISAYPDPDHYLRRNMKCIVAHSNRATAAVCLQQGGAQNDEIAFRLRWKPGSVPTYLRDCFQAVGDILQQELTGADSPSISALAPPTISPFSNPATDPARPPFQVPTFSHGPPTSIRGCRCWPTAPEQQAILSNQLPDLQDFYVWVVQFLDPTSQRVSRCTSSAFCYGSIGTPLWYTRPWTPYRRRLWGFGTPSARRSTHHDAPSVVSILPYLWTFLAPTNRWACHQVCSPWRAYVHLRIRACRVSISNLRHIRLPPTLDPAPNLDKPRAYLYACALSRFHFIYGDFIRWMSGEYTNRHQQWTKDFQAMADSAARPLTPDYPVPDHPRAFRICTEGVPLEGHFKTPASEIPARDTYGNHPAINANHANIEAKFVKEEAKSFYNHLPRFLIYFLPGLILDPLRWAIRKGKGRICVDCTNGPNPEGSANTSIPKPSADNADECPPVFYQHAFARHIRRLWRTRITHATEEILQHCDDIEAAFRRVLYHPDLAVAFAYVFGEYLIVPVGQVFGSRSAPSFFSLLSDLRAALSAIDISDPLLGRFSGPARNPNRSFVDRHGICKF